MRACLWAHQTQNQRQKTIGLCSWTLCNMVTRSVARWQKQIQGPRWQPNESLRNDLQALQRTRRHHRMQNPILQIDLPLPMFKNRRLLLDKKPLSYILPRPQELNPRRIPRVPNAPSWAGRRKVCLHHLQERPRWRVYIVVQWVWPRIPY